MMLNFAPRVASTSAKPSVSRRGGVQVRALPLLDISAAGGDLPLAVGAIGAAGGLAAVLIGTDPQKRRVKMAEVHC